MKTTLNEIQSYGLSRGRWENLLQHLDPRPADDEPLPVLRILDESGLGDAIWILSRLGHKTLLVRFAADCAEQVVKRYWEPENPDDRRPQEAIEAARAWVNDPTDENRKKAFAAATAADTAARHTAGREADAATRAARASWSAAAAATPPVATQPAAITDNVTAAVRRAIHHGGDRVLADEERKWQTERLRRYLEGE